MQKRLECELVLALSFFIFFLCKITRRSYFHIPLSAASVFVELWGFENWTWSAGAHPSLTQTVGVWYSRIVFLGSQTEVL